MISVNGKDRPMHVVIAEKALGRPLPKGLEVHHVDMNKTNNENSNLVICPSRAYHRLLHQRMDALRESGNADFIRCSVCHTYDDPKNIKRRRHQKCKTQYELERRRKNRLKAQGATL
jgi:hypothetical protein